MNTMDRFMLEGRTVIITGGAGLLGKKHAEAVLDAKGIPILMDISGEALGKAREQMKNLFPEGTLETFTADITDSQAVLRVCDEVVKKYGRVDGLINNAANNPKVEENVKNMNNIQFEKFPMQMWMDDIAVGLTGAFVCAQIFGAQMAKQKKGVILNISSDLGIIAPDQRIYRKEGLAAEEQSVKPVTYSVIKHGLLGLTKYLATYWAEKGVRANALCPAGVYNGQNEEFLLKLTNLIPMGRMADVDEYKGTIVYLLSDASGYMTGSTVIVDGGRTCW